MTFTGIDSTAKMLRGMKRRADDLRPVWPEVGDVISASMDQQFLTGGQAGGRPWAPLDPEYREWKATHGYDSRTLIKTGRMWRSLTSRPMSVEKYFKARAEFGSDVEYLKYHTTGTSRMPQREVLFRFEPMVTRANRKIAAWIIDGVTG